VHLLLYDGVCGLCNRLVRFVLDRDRANVFRFAALQSPVATAVLEKYGRDPKDVDTFYAIIDYGLPGERLLARGRAALFVLRTIRGGWQLTRPFGLFPTFVLDGVYDYIARHRYGWFGKLDACPIPQPGDADKFLDGTPLAAS
jgi:predicted DCC family thiol-disulfide oxidoreductase YuxK